MGKTAKLIVISLLIISLVGCGQKQDTPADQSTSPDVSQQEHQGITTVEDIPGESPLPASSEGIQEPENKEAKYQELLDTVTSDMATYHGTCGENINWYFVDDDVLILKGSGDMISTEDEGSGRFHFNLYTTPWVKNEIVKTNTKTVIIESGITSISTEAFVEMVNIEDVRIPDTVQIIDTGAFACCESLKSIDIPRSVKEIRISAFRECENLETVNGAEGLVALSHRVFKDSKLTNINLPSSVVEIGYMTFDGTPWLENQINRNEQFFIINDILLAYCNKDNTEPVSIKIPDNIRIIGAGAFEDCESLTEAIIPEGVVELGAFSFSGCENLTNIELPDSLESIDEGALSGTKITNFEIDDTFPRMLFCPNLKRIFPNALDGTEFLDAVSKIASLLAGQRDKYVVIDNLLFLYYPYGNTREIIIPDGVKYINYESIYDNSADNLSSIILPEGAEVINDYAFARCSELKQVQIPMSVTYMGEDLFSEFADPVIKCKPSSYAEEYAIQHSLQYEYY